MAKIKIVKKDPEAEQQTVSGMLNPDAPLIHQCPYNVGDWIIYEPDGYRYVLTDERFNQIFDKV